MTLLDEEFGPRGSVYDTEPFICAFREHVAKGGPYRNRDKVVLLPPKDFLSVLRWLGSQVVWREHAERPHLVVHFVTRDGAVHELLVAARRGES